MFHKFTDRGVVIDNKNDSRFVRKAEFFFNALDEFGMLCVGDSEERPEIF